MKKLINYLERLITKHIKLYLYFTSAWIVVQFTLIISVYAFDIDMVKDILFIVSIITIIVVPIPTYALTRVLKQDPTN